MNTTIDILVEALRAWKCPSCGGSGVYQQDRVGRLRAEARGRPFDPRFQPDPVTCKVCRGSKLHRTASEALRRVGQPTEGETNGKS